MNIIPCHKQNDIYLLIWETEKGKNAAATSSKKNKFQKPIHPPLIFTDTR